MASEREEFIKEFPVSYETGAKFDRYAELLMEWNQKFNLVAESTLPHIWMRHFFDSAQLLRHIPKDVKIVADIGSGAGFPGLVLSILGISHIHLIESTGKKANFLRTVVEELKLDAKVHQARVEDIKDLKADILTARAVALLPELLTFAKPLIKKDTICLFLKGQKADAELTESAKYWKFDHEKIQSLSDPSGSVLILKDIKIKHDAPRRQSHAKK